MNKKTLITICIAVLVVVAIAVAYFVFSNSDYAVYNSAFNKTFRVNSMELNTSVNAGADGSSVSANGSFMLKDINTETPQFINTMTINGRTVTQFSDGEYIYTDDGTEKNKLRMGDVPQPHNEKGAEFTLDAYISEFAGMLDASKIRELSALEPIEERYIDGISIARSGDRRRFDVTLLPAAVDSIVASFLSENLSDPSLAPDVTVNGVSYTAIVENGFISEVAFNLDMAVIPPGEDSSKDVTVDFKINPVNPGQPVSFTLPSTDGF